MLKTEKNVTASRSTVRRDLQALNLRAYVRPRAPPLTEENRKRRLAFAKATLQLLKTHTVYFTDEKWFDCNDNGQRYQYARSKSEVLPRPSVRFPPMPHVWGLIGANGAKRLVVFENEKGPDGRRKNVNSEVYCKECLKPNLRLLSKPNVLLMQDGARPHISVETRQFMLRHGITMMPNWPPYSPDLNPIENLWAKLTRKVSKAGPIDDKELKTFVEEQWKATDARRLAQSFKRRLEQCIANGGGKVKL